MGSEEEGYLTKCVVHTIGRKFNLYSSLGEEKTIECQTTQQFMNVLTVVRSLLDENTLVYADPFM